MSKSKTKCTCLNDCGDSPLLRTGQEAECCHSLARKCFDRRLAHIPTEELQLELALRAIEPAASESEKAYFQIIKNLAPDSLTYLEKVKCVNCGAKTVYQAKNELGDKESYCRKCRKKQ